MTTTALEVRCDKCGTKHTRNVKVIEPEVFSKDGTRSVLSQFWCPKCGQINAIRYEFYRNEKDEVLAKVKTRVQPMGISMLDGSETEN